MDQRHGRGSASVLGPKFRPAADQPLPFCWLGLKVRPLAGARTFPEPNAAISIGSADLAAIGRFSSVGSSHAIAPQHPMDARLLLVATPVLLAVGWAGFNIGRAAVGQLQLLLKRARA